MKLQYEKLSQVEYNALNYELYMALYSQLRPTPDHGIKTTAFAFDSDFRLASNLNDARFLFVPHISIVEIGSDGTMIHLVPKE